MKNDPRHVPTGSKPPAAGRVSISTSERHGFGARLCRPRYHPCNGEPEVRRSCRSWSNSSGRHRPSSQKSYPYASLNLLQRPPYACESWCLALPLPPWQDLAAEHHAQGLLNTDISLSIACQ